MSDDVYFVTGATGLLGNHVVRQLLDEGHHVRALVRSQAKGAQQFDDLPTAWSDRLTIVEGDMGNVAAFTAYLHEVDGLVHTAAYFRDSFKGGKHFAELVRINVDGTAQLFEAAAAAGIRRFVHVSSIGTLKPKEGVVGTIADARSLQGEPDDYFRSKILSDVAVEEFIQKHPEVHVGFILPGFMVGPGDLGPTSSGQMLLDFVHGRLPGVLKSGFTFVDARDVAAATLHLMHNVDAHHGERFIVAGDYLSVGDAYGVMEHVTGVKAPTLPLPDVFVYIYAAFLEIFARLTGRPVLLSWSGVGTLFRERYRTVFDSTPAKESLDVVFRPIQETYADTIADYRRRKMAPVR